MNFWEELRTNSLLAATPVCGNQGSFCVNWRLSPTWCWNCMDHIFNPKLEQLHSEPTEVVVETVPAWCDPNDQFILRPVTLIQPRDRRRYLTVPLPPHPGLFTVESYLRAVPIEHRKLVYGAATAYQRTRGASSWIPIDPDATVRISTKRGRVLRLSLPLPLSEQTRLPEKIDPCEQDNLLAAASLYRRLVVLRVARPLEKENVRVVRSKKEHQTTIAPSNNPSSAREPLQRVAKNVSGQVQEVISIEVAVDGRSLSLEIRAKNVSQVQQLRVFLLSWTNNSPVLHSFSTPDFRIAHKSEVVHSASSNAQLTGQKRKHHLIANST
jgi:hypothetical protein